MNNLSTSYQDAVFSGSRKYTMTTNGDNTVSFTDQTQYTTQGTQFGASDINATNGAINTMLGTKTITINQNSWTASGSVFYRDFNDASVTSTDSPVISLYIPWDTTRENAKVMQKNFSFINDITTNNGYYRVTVNKKPTSAFTIIVKGV